VRFCWPLTFGPVDRCAAILASLFISFQMKSYTKLCCTCRRSIVTRSLKKIVKNFECSSLIDIVWLTKRFEALMLSTVTNILNIEYFSSINILHICCSGITDGETVGRIAPGKLNVKTGHHELAYISISIIFCFSVGCCFLHFHWNFKVKYSHPHPYSPSFLNIFFWVLANLGFLQWPVGLFQLNFHP